MKPGPRAVRVGLLVGGVVIAASVLGLGGVPYVTLEKRWAIGIYTGPSPFDLHAATAVPNPVLSARDVTDVSARFVADPFMIERESTWYMFFEIFNAHTQRGEIGFARSSDGLRWTYGQSVLAEPFHLSYPYVFSFENRYYLIPESGAAHSVRLYESTDFPGQWTFIATLLSGGAFADSSVVHHEGKWFLFSETRPYVNDTLGLYYADRLTGPWREHPRSPIVTNNPHSSRPAGRVLASNGRLFRYAQDASPNYGTQVFAFEITKLTTATYEERPVSVLPILGPGEEGWNAKGMHQVDAHQLGDNDWIACVDGAQRTWGVRFYSCWR